MLASRLLALCRFMPRSCISAKSIRQITAPVTVRNFFLLPLFQFHRLPNPNAMPRRHASPGTRKAICPISDRKLPPGGTAIESSLPNRALSESGYAHDTPATLCMKRQTTHIIVIDISSLRLKSPLSLEPSSGGRRSAPIHGSEEGKRDKTFLMIYFRSNEEYID
jgi:hypothetical protein